MMARSSRHLSRTALEEYLADDSPAALVVPGDPYCRVVIEPARRRMSLRTPYQPENTASVTGFENVTTRTVASEGKEWSELLVQYAGQPAEAYLLVSDVADLMQISGLSFENAVRSALSTFDNLLTRTRGLSPEKQLGLYGELLLLESCLRTLKADEVLDAWRGFTQDEHDFVFPHACFEVKTTRAERRRHRISGLTQLEPLPGVPLWLLSIQLTSSSPGAGRTLATLIDNIRSLLGAASPRFDAMITQIGWRERDRPLYADLLALRSSPAAYPADARFPILNRTVIDNGCVRPELIVEATYTVDVTSLNAGEPPAPVDLFVEGIG
ncbi:PD-(D/E)XK motif protein [Actinoplanes sp. NPDC023714]|uniref:PD-(D/E)XK motif protein n=1 Tax=Actinoplanes sp. NPDC023714 TaxID=3154322 RepID=UPI0033FD3E1D